MTQKPLFLTEFALVRLLKEMLLDMGFSDTKADCLAQVHLMQSDIPTRWSEFIEHNCVVCKWTPQHCLFLNPLPEHCSGTTTPQDVKAANALMIETARVTRCPALEAEE